MSQETSCHQKLSRMCGWIVKFDWKDNVTYLLFVSKFGSPSRLHHQELPKQQNYSDDNSFKQLHFLSMFAWEFVGTFFPELSKENSALYNQKKLHLLLMLVSSKLNIFIPGTKRRKLNFFQDFREYSVGFNFPVVYSDLLSRLYKL